jgi:hypothetical protein
LNSLLAIRRVEKQVDIARNDAGQWPGADKVILVHTILHLATPHCAPTYFGTATITFDDEKVTGLKAQPFELFIGQLEAV